MWPSGAKTLNDCLQLTIVINTQISLFISIPLAVEGVTFCKEIFKTRMLGIYLLINSVKMEILRGKATPVLKVFEQLIIENC